MGDLPEGPVQVPPAWEQLPLEQLRGIIMVVGAPDTGKTTFARYLYGRLALGSRPVAFLDGDPGQSQLGPPTTLTVAVGGAGDATFPPAGASARSFLGAVSPRAHMLPLLTGVARLVRAARHAGAETIVYDTSGLIDAAQGGVALKWAKIDLLRPAVLFAIERERELQQLLAPLRRSKRLQLVLLRPAPATRGKDTPLRQANRAARYARYFADAAPLTITWQRLAIFPAPQFVPGQLVALEDVAGFALGLGIVQRVEPRAGEVTLLTPLPGLDRVDALRLGSRLVDPDSFRDAPLPANAPLPPGAGGMPAH